MNTLFKTYLSDFLGETITSINTVFGGDISKTYKISTTNNNYFLKTNTNAGALQMFQAEYNALLTIKNTHSIKAPSVLQCAHFNDTTYLLMEFIDKKTPSASNFETLGLQLAALHQNTNSHFGLPENNYIGTLQLTNTPHISWCDFYVSHRLVPQLELAKQNGLLSDSQCPSTSKMLGVLTPIFQNITPSLLHGDLWSGNYLIAADGTPYLIDPAMYYGHSEVDIAMSKLFGGFGSEFYTAYHSIIPTDKHTTTRIEIYQLYYLLIHLNLFGNSYYHSVINLLNKHF